jgi:beta-glucanase (GH16 family)
MRRRDLLHLCLYPIAPAMAEDRKRRLDLSGYELSFSTEFNDPKRPLLRSDGGPFSTRYEEWGGLRTLPGNKEEELYVDPDFVPAPNGTDKLGRSDAAPGSGIKPLGINPFLVRDGVLSITAIPTPAALRASVDRKYLSGMICTDRSFAQRYGYFEMRAVLPGGRGLWPAFWLVSKTQQEHIEIDVMEAIGGDTTRVYQSTHLKPSRGAGIHVRVGDDGFDYTDAVHSYGVEWTPDELVFYIDRVESTRTGGEPFRDAPPMYLIANLAVGGDWAGMPDSATKFPAVMRISHIQAYQAKKAM